MFADVSFTTESLVVITALLTFLCGVIGYLFREMLKAKDERLNEMKSYKEIAHEATVALEAKVNEERAKKGLPVSAVLAPVVPEHNSPVTEAQQQTADLQTLRAKITAAKLALGLPARVAPPLESSPPIDSSVKDQVDHLIRVERADLKKDIAEVRKDVAEVPAKVVEQMEDKKETPP